MMSFKSIISLVRTIQDRYQTLHLEYPVDMRPRHGHGQPPHPALYNIINANRDVYSKWLHWALRHQDAICMIQNADQSKDPQQPGWNNGFLPGLDIVMLYTIIAEMKPSTYIEVGSGNSTKVVYKAKQEQSPDTKIISMDPFPRAEIDALANVVIRAPFEKSDLTFFKNLKSGDIVFIDNSHRLFPNSDATVFFMEVLPELPVGVIVHVHDVYWPEDYPQFMCDRYYSEQYALGCYLLANPQRYSTLMPNYFCSQDEELKEILTPLWTDKRMPVVERHGGSFWLEIKE